ncbi:MAG: periplasmic sensor signal transduction histidine kinase [Mycobacterium sp.]|nr:periplasmic sensor signal transduction histidine kinase [Mycobacterium sp.]
MYRSKRPRFGSGRGARRELSTSRTEATWFRALPAPVVLPIAATALLAIGAMVALTGGGIGPEALLVLACLVVGATAIVGDAATLATTVVIAEFTAIGFTRRPYADLRGGPRVWHAGLILLAVAIIIFATRVAVVYANAAKRRRLAGVQVRRRSDVLIELRSAISPRRRWIATISAAVILPVLTLGIANGRGTLSLAEDLMLYLLVVVGVSAIGGFWPAVVTAAASGLLLNWFLTPPLHTLTIQEPQNLLALLLFVAVAVIVSSIVHLAARRAGDAARSSADADALLELARTVLSGGDTPSSILEELTQGHAARAELLERVAGRWVEVASSGLAAEQVRPSELVTVLEPRADLRLRLTGELPAISRQVLEGFGAQLAAALDRERLRIQAAQAEVLGVANRVRTALLTAVSHDLRTPLASVKAAITSLRQSDVTWSPEDEATLLATIEEGSDRLEALINNLLDMSRVNSGSLQPFLRPTALDEVVPPALRGIVGAERVILDLPDSLPLVATDAGLLERVVANLVANALRFSPEIPVEIHGRVDSADGTSVQLAIVDHGPGVAEAERERMFEPFQRLGDRIGSRYGAGVGLGLAVARGLTEAMGGQLRATDTPGGGLTMTVELRSDSVLASH